MKRMWDSDFGTLKSGRVQRALKTPTLVEGVGALVNCCAFVSTNCNLSIRLGWTAGSAGILAAGIER
jgi:hypothetical protein